MSLPKYSKYKDSGVEWLGDVPEGWEEKKLKHVSKIKGRIGFRGYTTDDLVDSSEGALVLGGTNLSTNGDLNLTNQTFISWSKYRESPEIQIEKYDIVFGQRGTCGKPVLISVDLGPTTINPSLVIIKSFCINQKYLLYWLLSNYLGAIIEILTSSTAVPMLSQSQIANFSVLCPKDFEQTAIAAFLDRETGKIDTLVSEQEKLIALLKEKRQALISHAVTKGLDPKAKMKASGIEWLGDMPERWEIKKLGYLCGKIGSGKTPSGGSEVYSDDGIVFIRSQNVYDDGLRLDDVVYISAKIDSEMAWSRVVPGDILLNITGASLGRTCIVPDEFPIANVNQHVCILRVTNKYFRQFVSLVMKAESTKSQISLTQTGAAREGLNFSQISNILICLPPLPEQTAIAAFLDRETGKIDDLMQEAERGIALLKERRSALISAAVTGKIDVRGLS